MQYTTLGESDVRVSRICLGTMNWGEQNTEADARAQLDMAVANGVNFIDTAEIYPSPPRAETHGLTETYLGNWLRDRGGRDRLVIATKVAGRSKLDWVREGAKGTRLDARNIEAAVEGSLRRLRTDFIDLLQMHWPERRTNIFGRLGYRPQPDDDAVPIDETLTALDALVRQGKVRQIGVCNETPWGLMRYLELARNGALPRVVTVQNPYSLLSRTFDIGLAEIAWRERVGLMAYSPLAAGLLSGKYAGGARPAGARLSDYGEHFGRYLAPAAVRAAERYAALAAEHGWTPAAMALAFVLAQPWTTSVITAATRPEQLEANLAIVDRPLEEPLLEAIEAVHREAPNPCP